MMILLFLLLDIIAVITTSSHNHAFINRRYVDMIRMIMTKFCLNMLRCVINCVTVVIVYKPSDVDNCVRVVA